MRGTEAEKTETEESDDLTVFMSNVFCPTQAFPREMRTGWRQWIRLKPSAAAPRRQNSTTRRSAPSCEWRGNDSLTQKTIIYAFFFITSVNQFRLVQDIFR